MSGEWTQERHEAARQACEGLPFQGHGGEFRAFDPRAAYHLPAALDEIERQRGVIAHQDRIIALNAGQTPSIVTDEMVERALLAMANAKRETLMLKPLPRLDPLDEWVIANSSRMRAALEAALGVKA